MYSLSEVLRFNLKKQLCHTSMRTLPLPLCFAGLLPTLHRSCFTEYCVTCHSALWSGVISVFVLSLSRSLSCAGLQAKSTVPQPQEGTIRAPDTSSCPKGSGLLQP